MGRRQVVVGDGITRQVKETQHLNGSTADEMRAFFAELKQSMHSPWGGQGEAIKWIREEFEIVQKAQPDIHTDFDAYCAYYKERVTKAWYLKAMVMHAEIAEQAILESRPWHAVSEAMILAGLLTELRLKLDWEPAAMEAVDARQNRAAGAEARRRAQAAARAQLVEEILAERQAGVRDALRTAAKRHPQVGSEASFRRDWYSQKKASQPIS